MNKWIGIFICIILLIFQSSNVLEAQNLNLEIKNISMDRVQTGLSTQVNDDGIVHFTYVEGEEEISFEPDFRQQYNSSHTFYYGQISQDGEILFTEKVIEELIFPLHYNFEIDSQNRIHTTFIGENFTLYYALRDPTSETWEITQLTETYNWLANSPQIALGSDEQPRIVYSAKYQEAASEYWENEGNFLINIYAIHYTFLNQSNQWETYDLSDNHTHTSNWFICPCPKDQTQFRSYNPSILIQKGRSYVTYNNRVSLSVESRIQFLTFPELPDTEFLSSSDSPFYDRTHLKVTISSTISTIYTATSMILLPVSPGEPEKQPMIMGFGSWTFGGANLAYIPDVNVQQPTNFQEIIWESVEIIKQLRSRQSKSLNLVYDEVNNNIMGFFSIMDIFSLERMAFTQEVYLTNIVNQDLLNDGLNSETITTTMLTLTTHIKQEYPSPIMIQNNKIKLFVLRDESHSQAWDFYRDGEFRYLSSAEEQSENTSQTQFKTSVARFSFNLHFYLFGSSITLIIFLKTIPNIRKQYN